MLRLLTIRSPRRLSLVLSGVLIVELVVALTGVAPAPALADPAESTTTVVDGKAAATAAASCWEIKQNDPSSQSGVYWLYTPALMTPQQFYCDQQKDGGGWVLIGRGREGWGTTNEGRGTAADVRASVTGPAAFSPKELSSDVIDALLNNGSVQNLDDGVRLHRANNTAGTSWQDDYFTFASPRDTWSWNFRSYQRAGRWTIGGVSGSGGYLSSFGSGQNFARIDTTTGAGQGWMDGFGYGVSARGTSDPSSYVWAPNSTSSNPRPFTQVFLRPKLTSSQIDQTFPQSGTDKIVGPTMAESFAMPTIWGVTGIGAGPNNIEGSNEVSAFTESNGIVYVGGNFTTVERSSSGQGKVSQEYLAAFNVRTGEWISTFLPTFDREVKALATLPDGRIAVGGFFTKANGRPAAGLVVLDPVTGQTSPGFTGTVINRLSGGTTFVRALDVQGNWLYVGGSFTHMTGGTESQEIYARGSGRMSVSDGTPDPNYNPEFNGTVISIDASSHGDRVYYAGFFNASRGTAAQKHAAISLPDVSVIPWLVDFSSSNSTAQYQQAVKEVGDRVWLGGSEHMLYSFDRNNLNGGELSTNVGDIGGDYQAISTDGSVVYAGCHCFWTTYAGSRTWPNIGTSWTDAEKINSAGAWDAETGAYLADWSPTVYQRAGAGAWGIFNDSTGVTWLGGDYTYSTTKSWTKQWSGGFVRFAPRDASAPATPSDLTVSRDGLIDTLHWSAATDDRGVAGYDIMRDDRVIATVTGTTTTVPATNGTSYFVRAVDEAGNRSASTSGVQPTVAPKTLTYIDSGSIWPYLFRSGEPPTGWTSTSFDASDWTSGKAPLGWGSSGISTTLTAPAPKPYTSYYRHTFTVDDPSTVDSVKVTTRADDGIIVYLNGTEIARVNIDAGSVTSTICANKSVKTSTATANPVVIIPPARDLVTGTNVVSAEVHSNYRSTPSASFDLKVEATLGPMG